MGKQISHKERIKIIELLIERDSGYRCFYDKKPFGRKTPILEHLDGNRNNNSLENLVLSCQSCNAKKVSDITLADLALLKKEFNEEKIFVGERNLNKILSKKSSKQEIPTEITINIKNYEIVENFVTDMVDTYGFIERKEAINSSIRLCKNATGHGSYNSVLHYIDSLCSKVGPFEEIRDEHNKKIIVRRKNFVKSNNTE